MCRYRDGITARAGAFSRAFVEQLREDMMTAFWDAIQRPGCAVGRGPRRWYVEAHPEAFQGFIELVTHPWVCGMAERVLGPRYEIVEAGLDVPFQGAKYQPWHRDFASPRDSYETPPHHFPGVQRDRHGRHLRHGSARSGARHAMGRRP
jgi:hypothetical protein